MLTLNRLLEYDSTLLDGVTLPDNRLDVDMLKSQIVIDCGNLLPIYDEPETMKQIIAQWFSAHAWNISRICDLIEIKYAPLENYDRMYTDDLQNTKTYNNTVTTDDDTTHDTQETVTRDTQVTTNNTETTQNNNTLAHGLTETTAHGLNTLHQVSAYDTSGFTNDNQTTNSGSDVVTNSGNDVTTINGTDTLIGNVRTSGKDITSLGGTDNRDIKTVTAGNDTDNNINSGRAHGNIGVTTSQQMFWQEVDLLQGFNVYTWISKCFRNDNCLFIW